MTSGTGTFTLTPEQDQVAEGDEGITIAGTSALPVTGTELTLTDDDTASTEVTLSVAPESVGEDAGATAVVVTATLDGSASPTATEVTVSVGAVGDGATAGTDYQAVSDFTVTVPAGMTSGTETFTLAPEQDEVAEGDETVSVTGTATGLAVTGTELVLTDDDTASTGVTLSVAPESVGEDAGATAVVVTATLGGAAFATATEVTVSVGASGDGAAAGTDYQAVTDFTVTIAEGSTTGTGTFTLTPTDDGLAEGDEEITVAGSATGLAVTGTELVLTDDDTASTGVTLSVAPGSVGEDAGATAVVVTATLGGAAFATATEVTVSVGASGDGATAGTDYQAVTDFTVTIAEGSTTGTGTFTLTPTDDGLAEGDEEITVEGSATGLAVTGTELTLTDDDEALTGVALSVVPGSVGEDDGATAVVVTATLGGAAFATATEVTVSVGASGDGATAGTDFEAVSDFTVTIEPGMASATGAFTLIPTLDQLPEGDETVTVSGTATGLTVSPATLMLVDSQTMIGSPTDLSATALDQAVRLTWVAPEHDGDVQITGYECQTGNGPWERTHFPQTQHTVAGLTNGTEYAFRVRATTAAGPGVAAGPIFAIPTAGKPAPPDPPLPSVSIGNASAEEGSRSMRFAVRLSAAAVVPVTVDYATLGETAEGGVDYEEMFESVTFAPGQTRRTIEISLLDDREDEEDETFEVHLLGASAADPADAVGKGTILDDDGPDLMVADVRALEAAGWISFTLRLSAASVQRISGFVGSSDGTATEGQDYRKLQTAFSIPPGRLVREVSVPLLDDTLDENDETFLVELDGLRNATAVRREAVGTIEDDDQQPALLVGDAAISEAAGEITFPVWLSVASGRTVTVDYATSDGSARSGTDYAAVSGSLRFAAGETGKAVVVEVLDDELHENNETFRVVLSGEENATLDDEQAIGTIEDDDLEPVLTISDARARESAGVIEFPATLSAVAGRDLSWRWFTADGEARANEDYEAQRAELTIPAGHRAGTLRVPLVDDVFDEADETFMVGLTNPGSPVSMSPVATGVIEDDDDNTKVVKMWITRFGRTVATQVVEAVEDRLERASDRRTHLTLGLNPAETALAWMPRVVLGENYEDRQAFTNGQRGLDGRELLSRTSFLVRGTDESASSGDWVLWGRGAMLRFGGEESGVSVTGDVLTTLAGFDYRKGGLLVGMALAQSVGDGQFAVAGSKTNGSARDGSVQTRLWSANPYLGLSLGERISVWGLAGYGTGEMTLFGEEHGSDVRMGLGAAGVRGDLWPRVWGSKTNLAVKSDVFWMRTRAGATPVRPASEGKAARIRVLMEGSWTPAAVLGGELTPHLEAGLRRDGGDAERGTGIEVGSGIVFNHRNTGLTVELRGRSLLAHQASAYREWGVGGTIQIDPGSEREGLFLRVSSSQGNALSGIPRLWMSREPLRGGAGFDSQGGRLETELGYGVVAFGDGSLMPFAGLSWQEGGADRAYRLGSRLLLGSSFQLVLEGARRNPDGLPPDYGVSLRGFLR